MGLYAKSILISTLMLCWSLLINDANWILNIAEETKAKGISKKVWEEDTRAGTQCQHKIDEC